MQGAPKLPVNPANEKEADIIRKTFSDELLKAMRMLMLGLGATQEDKNLIRATFADPDALALVSRRFLPTLNRDTQIGQLADVWMGTEKMVFGQSPSAIKQALDYKERSIDLTARALHLLSDPDGEPISVAKYVRATDDEYASQLMARNMFILHIEEQLRMLWMIHHTPKPNTPVVNDKKRSGTR